MEEVITISNLTKIFKLKKKSEGSFVKRLFKPRLYNEVIAVNKVDLKINRGEFIGLVGHNGAGKSTLIKMITGILYNSSGEIRVLGNSPYKKRLENNKRISVVFGQRTQLRWDLAPMDSFVLLKAIYNIDDDIYNENLGKFIKLFEMESFIYQPVRTLSLGQKMKCEITSAFLHNPEIVLLDEPTIGLDIFSKDAIINFLKEMKKNNSVTIILTTHNMSEISEVCDRAIFLDKGSVIVDEKIDKLMEINSIQRNVTLILENKIPIEVNENLECEIIYENHKIILKKIHKEKIQKAITKIMADNTIKDISISQESFTDIVKKIYKRDE